MKAGHTVSILASMFVVLELLSNCSPRQSLPLEGPLTLNNEERAGEKIFMVHCQRCHPHGEAGLGPAINPVPAFAKRFQTRHGVGVMPAFDEQHIGDNELDQLVVYLKALKRN